MAARRRRSVCSLDMCRLLTRRACEGQPLDRPSPVLAWPASSTSGDAASRTRTQERYLHQYADENLGHAAGLVTEKGCTAGHSISHTGKTGGIATCVTAAE